MNNNQMRIFKILLSYKKLIGIIIFLTIISMISSFFHPLLEKRLMDDGFIKTNFDKILLFALLILALTIFDQIINFLQTLVTSKLNLKFNYRLHSIVMSKMLNVNMKYINAKNFTELINNSKFNISKIVELTDNYFLYSLFSIFKILGGMLGLIIINYKLAIGVLFFIPIKFVIVSYLTSYREKEYSNLVLNNKKYASWYGDRMTKIKEIRLSNSQHEIKNQFKFFFKPQLNNYMRLTIINNFNAVSDYIYISIVIVLIYIFGGLMVTNNTLTIGAVFAFSTYSIKVLSPINSLLNLKFLFSNIDISINEFYDFVDLDNEETVLDETSYLQDYPIIKINNVDFSYDTHTLILNDICLEILEGERVAIVGENGSGKSTLLDLLLRINDDYSGDILYKGKNIKSIKHKMLRNKICYTSQNAGLFEDTILNNLQINNKTQKDIDEIIRKYSLFQFIYDLPYKLDTKIMANTTGLSGGQMKLILILKSLLHESEIKIYDEPTLNLDISSQKKFRNIIKDSLTNTIILVTHNTEFLNEMDKVIFLREGRIECIGNHDMLIKNNRLYKKFINSVLTNR